MHIHSSEFFSRRMNLAQVYWGACQMKSDFHEVSEKFSMRFSGPGALVARHVLFSIIVLFFYMVLNRPDVILLSNLGFTAWYPAVGLIFAVLLAISPRYMPLLALADILASVVIYHQPLYRWSVIPAAVLGSSVYAAAAYLLRNRIKIDVTLRRLSDVARYLAVTMTAMFFATLVGVVCLAADRTIGWNQFWSSAAGWYIGDAIGLLSVAPFLLIYIFPWIRKQLVIPNAEENDVKGGTQKITLRVNLLELLEAAGQAISIVFFLWIIFGRWAPKQYFYLASVPIIWIAMRHGIDRVVIGLLGLNFGIVVALRFFPAPPEILTKFGLLMLTVSAIGLIVGAAVTERRYIGDELTDRTIFLNSLVETSPFGIVVHDLSGTVKLCNDAFENLYLFKRSEVVGKNLHSLIVPPDLRDQANHLQRQVNAGESLHQTVSRMRKGGTFVNVEMHVIPMINAGRVRGTYVIYKDISVELRVAAEAKAHAESLDRLVSELQLRTNQLMLLNEMGNLLQSAGATEEVFEVIATSAKKLFTNSLGGTLYVFKSSRNLLELAAHWGDVGTADKVFAPSACWSLRRGQPHWSLSSKNSVTCAHLKEIATANYLCVPLIAQGDTIGVLQLKYVDNGTSRIDDAFDNLQQSEQRLGVAVAGQTALSLANIRLRESLRDQSIRDPLTGLFNRRFMQESLDREILRATRKNRSLAMIFVDVDHFKHFNDVYGHEAGDEVLRSMGSFFRSHFRGDDVICRYGGEEFAIILPESSAQDAAVRAEVLRVAAKNLKIVHQGTTLDAVTLSAGIAGYPEHASSAAELLQVADACLYEAKTSGRDQIMVAKLKLI